MLMLVERQQLGIHSTLCFITGMDRVDRVDRVGRSRGRRSKKRESPEKRGKGKGQEPQKLDVQTLSQLNPLAILVFFANNTHPGVKTSHHRTPHSSCLVLLFLLWPALLSRFVVLLIYVPTTASSLSPFASILM